MKHKKIDLPKERVTGGRNNKEEVSKVRRRINAEKRYRNKKPLPDITSKKYLEKCKNADKQFENQEYEDAYRVYMNIISLLEKKHIELSFISSTECMDKQRVLKCFENMYKCVKKICKNNVNHTQAYLKNTGILMSSFNSFAETNDKIAEFIKKSMWYNSVMHEYKAEYEIYHKRYQQISESKHVHETGYFGLNCNRLPLDRFLSPEQLKTQKTIRFKRFKS
jgi:hypothetical protein